MNKPVLSDTLKCYFWITVGSILYGFAFDWFYPPNQIGYGGITGVGQVVNAFLPAIPIGTFVLVVNIPLFILGWKFLGGHLLISSLYSMALSSVAVDVFPLFLDFQPMDSMLAAVCGGALIGLALGLIFAQGATTGGTELAARLLKLKLESLSIGTLCLAIDILVTVTYALIFRDLTRALYGMISLSLISVSIDKVVYGPNAAKVAYIISDCHEELTHRLLELDRGVTLLQGKGAYSGKDKQVILCACARTQIIPVKRAVQEIDPDAFVIVCDAHEILGEGFGVYAPGGL